MPDICNQTSCCFVFCGSVKGKFPLIEAYTQQISHPEPNFEKIDMVLTSKNVREFAKIQNSLSALLCCGIIYYAVEV